MATQTVEVGANLDFDALVTEAAPLDALRQRFGRLDRLGKRHERGASAAASIVIRSDHAKNSDEDPIYGSAIAATWKWLSLEDVASTTGKGAVKRQVVDFGINSLDAKLPKERATLQPMLAEVAETPTLFPAHLDAWAQTSPRPDPDPDVGPFLHGSADAPADVLVVWRADLDEEREPMWPAIVSAMPPMTREALPVPVYEVRAWLQNAATGDVADVEGADSEVELGESSEAKRRAPQRVVRWRGRNDVSVAAPDDLRPGDTIVVPTRYGGSDRFGWNPARRDAVEDVAERCLAQLISSYPSDAFRRPKMRLRLHPSLLPGPDDGALELRTLLKRAVGAMTSERQDAWSTTRRLLEAMLPAVGDPHVSAAVRAMLDQRCRLVRYPADDGIVVIASVAINALPMTDVEREEDEPEGDEASFTGRMVPLGEHTRSVAETARRFARATGLEHVAEAFELAGQWHDQGKRDWRFQAWLRGSELQALAEEANPIAKSGRDRSQWGASTDFGYPRGARHELVSVRLFERADRVYADGVNS